MNQVTDFQRDQNVKAAIFLFFACLALVLAVASVVFK